MNVFWFLPTHGDGHFLGTSQGARPVSLPYLKQVAQAADSLGYHGVLIPTGRSCEDSWVVASALAPLTERLRFLVAIRPGIVSPTVSARMAATLDRLSGGRLLINVVTGGDPDENRGDGIHLGHAERYELTDEFLRVWRRVLQGEAVDFHGKHIHVENAKALYPPLQRPYPPLYFGGSSEAAHELAGEQVDVYLTWGGCWLTDRAAAWVVWAESRTAPLSAAASEVLPIWWSTDFMRGSISWYRDGRERSAGRFRCWSGCARRYWSRSRRCRCRASGCRIRGFPLR